MEQEPNPKGWYSRGYLPHFDGAQITQFITFRLADSIPASLIDRWTEELRHLPDDKRQSEERSRIMKFLDQGFGECWLKNPEVASMVEGALLHFDGERYKLNGWTIMPNHIHILATFDGVNSMGSVLHSWKSFSAHEANKLLNRKGPFWFREFYDRYIRDDVHYGNVMSYIAFNPVKAKLCESPQDWPYGSARFCGNWNSACQRDAGAPS